MSSAIANPQPQPIEDAFEFHIDQSELLRELSTTQGVVERKTTIPILTNFLFEATGNNLIVAATDLDVSLRTVCSAEVQKPGSCAVPARKLYEYIRLLPQGSRITMKSLPNNWVQIRSGRSHTKLVGLPRASFPTLPLFPAKSAIALPKDILSSMIAKTTFAISTEESRHTLNGALLILEPGWITMVATDGHRLTHVRTKAGIGVDSETRLVIPKKALIEIYSLLNAPGADIVQFATDDSTLFFRIGARLLTSRRLAGAFPSFERVMPQGLPHSLSLGATECARAVQRVAQFSDTNSKVRFRIERDALRLSSRNTETGESEETLEVAFAGDPKNIAFNSRYLLEFLKAVGSDKVMFHFNDHHSAAEWTPHLETSDYKYRYVLMPMMAND